MRIRAAVESLPDYNAGRTPALIAAEGGPAAAVKLSGNESPYPPLPGVIEAVARASELNRYPTPYADALRAAIGERLAVDADVIAPAGGSLQLCRSVVEATCDPGDEVIAPMPAFSAYRMAAELAGARFVGVPVLGPSAAEGPGLDVDAMAAAVGPRTRVVFLCSPHNPTSTGLAATGFVQLMAAVPRETLVVLDEAYAEFATDADTVRGMDMVASHPNLVVLRTFSKAYGLAGARIGYAVSGPVVAAALRRVTSPFSVSMPAEAAALAALHPQALPELRRRRAEVIAERTRLTGELRRRGVDVADSAANFLWISSRHGPRWARDLERHGVITRPYPDLGLRVTVGRPSENDAFLRAFSDIAGDVKNDDQEWR
ncbi:histidinol-phosphate transaminase [Tomitella fengzijianii]|uniref:histidinol-phosphate transaminase n=1 Tax=Tomitella fengzijianii TaxID=2597660 RepID=UPI0018EEE86F|nr:histidinol-phosphate transaminase [Tomitella fengzijianii]